MIILPPSVLATLALLVNLTVAGPRSTSSSILPRKQHCTNAPNVVVGSTYTPQVVNPRGNPIRTYWCAPNSRTYIVFGRLIPIAGSTIFRLLINFNAHLDRLLLSGDDPLLIRGDYIWGLDQEYNIRIGNANNHQCTYGVMRAAVSALRDYMVTENEYGTLAFEIWDGDNQVGQGAVELGDLGKRYLTSSGLWMGQ